METDNQGHEAQRRHKSPGRRPLAEGDAQQTRDDIRRHATRLFNERGYAAVSMEDILAATGLTRGTLYYHFKGKSDIFVASMLTMMEAMRRASEAIIDRQELTVEERIRLLVRAKREKEEQVAAGHEDEFALSEKMMAEAMRHLSPTQQAHIGQAMHGIHLLMQRLMAEGIARGELRPFTPELLDYAFWQMFTQSSRLPGGTSQSRAQQEEHLLDMFFCGVRAV